MKTSLDLTKRVYKTLGLKEVTSETQKKNGTIAFQDTKIFDETNVRIHYTFHTNGYYRRKIIDVMHFPGYKETVTYQLNPKMEYFEFYNPNPLSRVLIGSQAEQMVRALNNILLYRKKYNLE